MTGGLHSRAADFGSGIPLTRWGLEAGVWRLGSWATDLDLATYLPAGIQRLGSRDWGLERGSRGFALGVYSLGLRILDLATYLQRLGSRGWSLEAGVYTLGVYSLGLRILDLASCSPAWV